MADAAIDVLAGPDAVIKATIPAAGDALETATPMVDVTEFCKALRMRGPYRTADVTAVGARGSRRNRGATDETADLEFISEGEFMRRVKTCYRTTSQEVQFEIGPDGDTPASGTEQITFQGFFSDAPHEITGGEGEQRFSVPIEIQGQATYGTY